MSVFLFSTYELDSAGGHHTDTNNSKVLDYIVDNLNELHWQEALVKKIGYDKRRGRKIKIYLRFFRQNRIEENNLRSYSRFMRKENCLIIDPIFSLKSYNGLECKELSAKIYDDVFQYLEFAINKYEAKFDDFDFPAFFKILLERFQDIRAGILPQDENNQLEKLLDGII